MEWIFASVIGDSYRQMAKIRRRALDELSKRRRTVGGGVKIA